MIRSSRRAVIKGSVALAALGIMAPPVRARSRTPAIFIYDARFEASRQLAQLRQMECVAILDPRDHDLGLAWREQIPRLLVHGGGIEGATLWSDRFVCEVFAKEHGLSALATEIQLPGSAGGALRHWGMA